MKSIVAVSLCLALLVGNVYAQFPFFGGGNGEGIIWGGWGGSGGGSDGDGSGSGSSSGSGGSSNAQSEYLNFDVNTATRYATAHGIIAAVCFTILFPVGAIIVRVVPSRHTWIIHGLFQGLAYLLYVAAAALGIRLIQIIKIPPNDTSLLQLSSSNAHPIIGIVILAVLFFMPPLGFAHHAKFKQLKRRTIYSYAHLWLGRATLTLGIINGGLGLQLARASQSVIIAYSVIGGIMWLIWLLAAVIGEMRRRPSKGRDQRVEPRRRMGNLPPTRSVPRGATPNFGGDGRYHHDSSSDNHDPSPPYTPRPMYGGPPGYTGPGREHMEMRPVKNPGRGSASFSSYSSEQVPRDGTRRV
ncbi:hypothetical protein F5Y13DRAFT_104456 [Hypoxylon sp. FL1857]|nr:hypothetical protein F5Y13DRAFT_104456 [Hypoxylon sp. FL1857]